MALLLESVVFDGSPLLVSFPEAASWRAFSSSREIRRAYGWKREKKKGSIFTVAYQYLNVLLPMPIQGQGWDQCQIQSHRHRHQTKSYQGRHLLQQ
jgi:hypothetical protein